MIIAKLRITTTVLSQGISSLGYDPDHGRTAYDVGVTSIES